MSDQSDSSDSDGCQLICNECNPACGTCKTFCGIFSAACKNIKRCGKANKTDRDKLKNLQTLLAWQVIILLVQTILMTIVLCGTSSPYGPGPAMMIIPLWIMLLLITLNTFVQWYSTVYRAEPLFCCCFCQTGKDMFGQAPRRLTGIVTILGGICKLLKALKKEEWDDVLVCIYIICVGYYIFTIGPREPGLQSRKGATEDEGEYSEMMNRT